MYFLYSTAGTRWRSWLRHCATSRKVARSIPDGANGIFHWHNPSGRSGTLGLTQPLTEMSTRNMSRGVKAAVRRADNLTTFFCWLSWYLGASTTWNPHGLSRPIIGLRYPLLLLTFRNRASYIYMNATLRYHPDVAFCIFFFNKYKYWVL
jgi:hypothetical protein